MAKLIDPEKIETGGVLSPYQLKKFFAFLLLRLRKRQVSDKFAATTERTRFSIRLDLEIA
jgi:hypothetical protein